MADDFDLYGDLNLEPVEPVAAAAPVPVAAPQGPNYVVPPWRRQSTQPVQVSSKPKVKVQLESNDTGEKEDGEEVRALWEKLMSAEGINLDDEDDFDFEDFATPPGEAGLDAACDDAAFLLNEEEDAPSLKRRRLDADTAADAPSAQRAAEPAAAEDDDAFDFEADLPPVTAASSDLVVLPQPADQRAAAGGPQKRSPQSSQYFFNPQTKRWEVGTAAAVEPPRWPGYAGAKGKGRGLAGRVGQRVERKTRLCRMHQAGHCKWGDDCWDAHGESEVKVLDAQALRERFMAQCAWMAQKEARAAASEHNCAFPQALVVRLALRLEARPDDILPCMEKAGLPASEDRRTTVKALLRLCHPDKCSHPDAKRAVQIIGPLLGKAS